MAYNIRTIIKIFMIFLLFQISLILIIDLIPTLNSNLTQEDQLYINFLNTKTNFLGSDQTSLLDDLKNSMPSEGLFNGDILNSFLGMAKIIASTIEFIVQIAINTLICPTIMIEILFYNFTGNNGSLTTYLGLLFNIGFYSLMFFITFREGTK